MLLSENKINDDISLRESQFFNAQDNSKTVKIQESQSKIYIRNNKGETKYRALDVDTVNLMKTQMLDAQLVNDSNKTSEKVEVNKILKIELILVMLKNKNMHKNVVSDFEQNRCK